MFKQMHGLSLAVLVILTLITIAIVFAACYQKNNSIIFKTNCNGKNFELQKKEVTDFGGRHVSLIIVMGSLPGLTIEDDVTMWLPEFPYDSSLLKNISILEIDTASHDYAYKTFDNAKLDKIILFMNPVIYSKNDFEAMAACMKANKDAIAKALGTDNLTTNKQVAYLVYGDKSVLTQRFVKDAKNYILVYANGVVQPITEKLLHASDVIMPGHKINFWTQEEAPQELDLKLYKNKNGQSIADIFNTKTEAGQIIFSKNDSDYITIVDGSYVSTAMMKTEGILKPDDYINEDGILPLKDTSADAIKALSSYKTKDGVSITDMYKTKK